jgi:outer membrane protein assembly factor BamB
MGKHKWLLIIPISLILIQSYCMTVASSANTSSSTDDWTMFRHDPSHSGYTSGTGTTNSAKLLWIHKTWGEVRSSPAVTNGCVFIGSRDSRIFCLNASNGELFWNCSIVNRVNSSPAIYNNSLYVCSYDGNIYCLDIATGKVCWKSPVGSEVQSSPTIADGCVYVGSGDHDVFCFNASSGAKIRIYPTADRVQSSPAVSNGVVYAAADNYHVYAFNESTGKEIWRVHTGSYISSPTIYNGYVYIGSIDGYICGLNASTGAKIWMYQTENSVFSSPAVAYGCVYAGSDDNNVYCLNASNGKKIWQSPTGYWVRSSPAVADGNVYVGSEDFNIYCFNASTGAKKWSYATKSSVDSSPAIANGKLYVGSNDRNIYALALVDSTVESVPSQSADSLPWTTIVFDVIACAVAAAIIIIIMRFIHSTRQTKQNAEATKISDQKRPWFSEHADALCILAILAFSTIFFVNLGSGSLWVTDEQTYSQWAFHMFKTGDYLTPWSYGELDIGIGKPPLFMWLMSLAYQVFGVNNFAARFWSPVFGTLSLVLIFYLGKKLYNQYVGFLSALVLGTFTTFYVFARHAMTDVPFVFFTLASIYFLLLSEKTEGTNRYAALGGMFFGLAFMTKQIVALLIPLIVFSYFTASGRSIRFLFTKRFTLFWRVGLLVVSPWMIYMILRFGPDFWQSFFVYSGVLRAITPLDNHVGGYLYYFSYLFNNENLFWVILLPFAAGLCAFNSVFKRLKEDTLILAWMSIVLVTFTFVQTKLAWYILPAFPAFAIAISSFLYQLSKKIQLSIRSFILKLNRILFIFFP